MKKFVLTVIGDDRPGLVSALSATVADAGGNWLESQMARLGGKFAGIALVETPDGDALRASVGALSVDRLLDVTFTPADGEAPFAPGSPLHVFVLGHDRPGILRELSAALASHGVTIERLETATRSAPMGDGLLFEADADVSVPEGVSLVTVRAALEALSDDLVVDLDDPES